MTDRTDYQWMPSQRQICGTRKSERRDALGVNLRLQLE